jgi:hypothetical protein
MRVEDGLPRWGDKMPLWTSNFLAVGQAGARLVVSAVGRAHWHESKNDAEMIARRRFAGSSRDAADSAEVRRSAVGAGQARTRTRGNQGGAETIDALVSHVDPVKPQDALRTFDALQRSAAGFPRLRPEAERIVNNAHDFRRKLTRRGARTELR